MPEQLHILLIDDSRLDARIVQRLLSKVTSPVATLSIAAALGEGTARAKAGDIDAVLLDLSLPETSGLETVARFQLACPTMPVLILTSSDSEELAIAAVRAGAQDYLLKWTFPADSLMRAVRYPIERQRRRHLEACFRATETELRVAREIQQKLCPAVVPSLPGFELAGAWYPAQATCGDYYDFVPMNEHFLALVIGDVCGHGLGPALVMAETRACLRTLAETTLDVAEILTTMNRLLAHDLDGDRFVTLLLARLDLKTRHLVYAAAGHQAFLFDVRGDVITLDSTSLPLGLDPSLVVKCGEQRQLKSGELLLMTTDGVQEALSPDGRMFGLDRVVDVVRKYRCESAERLIALLRAAVEKFARGTPQADDFTAIALKAV